MLGITTKPKELLTRNKTLEKVEVGMKKVNDKIAITMGGRGRHVLIEGNYGTPVIINDGVNIARNICLKDPVENMGARIIIDSANQVAREIGDGTSLTVLLLYTIFSLGKKAIKDGVNPNVLAKQLNSALDEIMAELDTLKNENLSLDDLYNVAFISSRDEKLSNLIVEALDFVGEHGAINVDKSYKREDYLEKVSGMIFPIGYRTHIICTNKRTMVSEFNGVRVILVDDELKRPNDIYPILDLMMTYSYKANDINPNADLDKQLSEKMIDKKNFVIIANAITDEVVSVVRENIENNDIFNSLCNIQLMHTPTTDSADTRDYLEDIQALCNGNIITKQQILRNELRFEDFGYLDEYIGTMNETILKGIEHEKFKNTIDERVEYLKSLLETKEVMDSENKESKIKERISKLTSGLATIKLYANTETEYFDKKERLDDALRAVRSAKIEGICPGGGVTLRDIAIKLHKLDEKSKGREILLEAIQKPFFQIIENADIEMEYLVFPFGKGVDVTSGETVDMLENGIIDTIAGIKMALSYSLANAIMALRISGAIVNAKENNGNSKYAKE